MINKYIFRSHISEKKFRHIIQLFSLDLEASKIAQLTHLHRNSINRILMLLRQRLVWLCEQESILQNGDFECDESYFGSKRVRGRRGKGAKGKTIVFGTYQRNTKRVYTQVVQNVKSKTLIPIIKSKISKDSIICTDGFRSYSCLQQIGYSDHSIVNHGSNEFVRGNAHVNGIENFWGVAKTRLVKFRGLSKSSFLLYLKECEYRFNHKHEKLYDLLLNHLRIHPLN